MTKKGENKKNSSSNFASKITEIEEKVIEIKRVSKKTKGGNTIGFTALVVAGDRNGKVGYGYGKARNVAEAIGKAVSSAKKDMYKIKLTGKTIAHEVTAKSGASKVLFKPAPEGSGIIAGGSVRTVVDLAGIKDISSKILGSNNKLLNVRCAIKALKKLKK
jgi:small subunit ribosomal protein S5